MDTSQQTAVVPKNRESSVVVRRQQRSIAEKRRIVEETLSPGASVARVARAHGVNANQVFGWRRLYLAGRLGEQKPGIKLLPVHADGRHRLAAARADVGTAVVGVTQKILCTTFFACAGMQRREFMRYSAHGGERAPRSERPSCRATARTSPGATSGTAHQRRATVLARA